MSERKANILIVDDEPGNLFVLEQLLARPDRKILSATTGKRALTIALNQEINLIILDIHLPDIEGNEVAKILRSNRRTRSIPLLFASAEADLYRRLRDEFQGDNVDYLTKPLDKEVVKAKVEMLLQSDLQQRDLLSKASSLEKFTLLINNSADLIGIIDPLTMKIEEINAAAVALLGYRPREMMGKPLLHFLPEDGVAAFQRINKDKGPRFSIETRIFTHDKSIRWLHWNITQQDNLWFVNARDITDSREVEEVRNYLATVVKQSADAIYLLHKEGGIISWNAGAEQMYGFTEAEALRMKLWNLVPAHLMAETEEIIDAVLLGEKIKALETRRMDKYGKMIDVLFSATLITDRNGEFKSVALTERNITQQKKAAEEIRQLNAELKRNLDNLQYANQELESFSYSVSHDLRAPLRGIVGIAQIIEEDYAGKLQGELLRLFDMMKDSAIRMDQLIKGLLSFSKLGRKEIVSEPIDFNDLVEKVVAELGTTENDRAEIRIEPLHSTEGDYLLLYQVFTNLISNALKYSSKKEDPKIRISSVEEENEIIYCVQDNGAGFDMANIDYLFGVFQRLHDEKEFEGTGVGLATVQRIILKHGGRIWAEGIVDEGATFYFSLPKIHAPAPLRH